MPPTLARRCRRTCRRRDRRHCAAAPGRGRGRRRAPRPGRRTASRSGLARHKLSVSCVCADQSPTSAGFKCRPSHFSKQVTMRLTRFGYSSAVCALVTAHSRKRPAGHLQHALRLRTDVRITGRLNIRPDKPTQDPDHRASRDAWWSGERYSRQSTRAANGDPIWIDDQRVVAAVARHIGEVDGVAN